MKKRKVLILLSSFLVVIMPITILYVSVYTSSVKKELKTFLNLRNLGNLLTNDESSIRLAINYKNLDITNSDYKLSNITTTSATAIGVGKYQGAVNVTF
ncbi:hypothetical protein, partial [Mesoplasma corruscae]|uniref:hypothetical protein n=1 Tax=Mesoplasma corruscae TaxID=216874 RepID=UPI0011AFED2E